MLLLRPEQEENHTFATVVKRLIHLFCQNVETALLEGGIAFCYLSVPVQTYAVATTLSCDIPDGVGTAPFANHSAKTFSLAVGDM